MTAVPPRGATTRSNDANSTKSAAPALEGALHDMTNALAAARSYAEILMLRAESGSKEDPTNLLQSLLKELDRVGDIARLVRGGVIEEYQPGDVLACADCNYTFVYRKAAGKLGSCRRCKSVNVTRWKP